MLPGCFSVSVNTGLDIYGEALDHRDGAVSFGRELRLFALLMSVFWGLFGVGGRNCMVFGLGKP